MPSAPEGAVAPSLIHQLSVSEAFERLASEERLYAHHLSRAAWHGARIILRQVSPESESIYDFILGLYSFCSGDWRAITDRGLLQESELEGFLEYAATFLSNIGNYYGHGDQKFVPSIPSDSMAKLATCSSELTRLYNEIAAPIYQLPPYGLGFPSVESQSAYYPGPNIISQEAIALVSQALETRKILPENTRICKLSEAGKPRYEVLQASVETDTDPQAFTLADTNALVVIKRGDHASSLEKVCSSLSKAAEYAKDDKTRKMLSQYIESFRTGNLEAYRDSQRTWITDKSPRVENIFGFVEPYRDPYGIRSEFEGLVAINDAEETKALLKLVEHSDMIIKRLPWTNGQSENSGKGPFEKALFEPPDLTSIHALAYCSSIIFPGINLPNYNDIRETCGFKNVIIANRMSAESNRAQHCPFVEPAELAEFQRCKYPAYYWWVVLHELLGHGTGRMMFEETAGRFNFDSTSPPIDPLSGEPIKTWYKPGQTWTGQFEDLATTVDECRAELVGAYLMDDVDVLNLIGFTKESEITSDELTYNLYQQLGVDGLRGLANFNTDNMKWGQAHSRAHFAMLKCLLLEGGGCVRIDCDEAAQSLVVRVDRSKIRSHGKHALGRMLLKLHMYRCTADARSCRKYYEDLSRVDGQYIVWRTIVLAKKQPRWVYSFANTFVDGENVALEEYPPTTRGVVQSWAERAV